MKLIYNPCTDPAYNLAFEQIAMTALSGPVFLLWRNRPAIIVGRNQNTLAEIDSEYVEHQGIAVVRRNTGGGAVYHDLGNVNYSFIGDCGGPFDSFAPFAEPVIAALGKMGVDAVFSGRNDILVDGRKVSGSAKCFHGGRVLFHGTLLFDVDLNVLGRALTPDPCKIASKGIASVRSRVANLKEFLPKESVETFLEKMRKLIAEAFFAPGFEPPRAEMVAEAEALAESKYRSWQWNYGSSCKYGFSRRGYFAGVGSIAAHLEIQRGEIVGAEFTGDFFGERDCREFAASLQGCKHEKVALRQRIATSNLKLFFGDLTPAQLLSVLF
ncbi:MAG: lipoate--protein ligase [Victivallaceae bacterium]|nr:lipoate--protein ligase [Victivallaceae bacterium]